MSWNLTITGHSLDAQAERVILEASRKFVRVLEAHSNQDPPKTTLTVANFGGAHGGNANLFNPSDEEAAENARIDAEKLAAETGPKAEDKEVAPVDLAGVSL